MARCEACDNECPEGAAFCGVCGHRLGERPAEPLTVNVRVVDSPFGGCLSCLSTAVAIVVIVFVVAWLFSC
jgi:rRNA maturation endonuclease Nob1